MSLSNQDLTAAAAGADPLVGLRAVRALRRLLEHLEETQVRRARADGWSWQEIADVLGVSRQAVHKKTQEGLMFEKFTRRARAVVAAAVEEARDAGSPEVRPEHVLEAVLAEGSGVAVAVLAELGAPAADVRRLLHELRARRPGALDEDDADALRVLGIDLDEVVRRIDRDLAGGSRSRRGHLPFTKGCKKALELSLREALQLGDGFIGTEHLLLGLVRGGDPVVLETLAAFDIDPDRLRTAIAAAERRTG